MKDPHMISDICSSLVVITPTSDNQAYIQLAHPSVQRYLTSQQLLQESDPSLRDFAISKFNAHTLVATSCLRYIFQFSMHFDRWCSTWQTVMLSQMRREFPLCEYALVWWPWHYYRIPDDAIDTTAERLVLQLLDGHHHCHIKLYDSTYYDLSRRPLRVVSNYGLTRLARKLLQMGADVNGMDSETALHTAAQSGHPDVVELLLDYGAKINQVNCRGQTAVDIAALNRQWEVEDLLLDRGGAHRTNPPLHIAALRGQFEDILTLLDEGADVDAAEDWGKTALRLAAEAGHLAIVQLLLERGADPNKVDHHGCIALEGALNYPAANEAVIPLVSRSIDPTAIDLQGRTSLHLAACAKSKSNRVLNILLGAGMSPDARDRDGWTPLHWAARGRLPSSIMVLLDAGADKAAKNKDGWTPYDVAKFNNKDVYVCEALRTTKTESEDKLSIPTIQCGFSHQALCDSCQTVGELSRRELVKTLIRSRTFTAFVTNVLIARISISAPNVIRMRLRLTQITAFAVLEAKIGESTQASNFTIWLRVFSNR